MSYYAEEYWRKRSDMLYYRAIDYIIRVVGHGARSMVDVGSGNCPYLEWWSWIEQRVSVDIRAPYSSDAVQSVVGNILEWQPEQTFDVCSCFQVLEHVDDPTPFTRRLFELGKVVVISVPYKWPEGRTRGHVQDPVDRDKLKAWAGRSPNFSMVVAEPFGSVKHERLIAAYHPDPRFRWKPAEIPNRILRETGPIRVEGA